MATETKRQTRDRLMAEGRWPEFVKAREEFKVQGKPPAEAHALALADFQPLNGSAAPARAGTKKAETRKRGAADLRRDMLWAYENLDIAEPKGAPSRGAKILHAEARASEKRKGEFLSLVIQRSVGVKGEREVEAERRQREIEEGTQRCLDELDNWMARVQENWRAENPPGEACPPGVCRWEKERGTAEENGYVCADGSLPAGGVTTKRWCGRRRG